MALSHILLLFCCFTFTSPIWGLTEEEISKFVARPYVEHNTGLQGTVSVVPGPKQPNVLLLQANGIPDHDTGNFPNSDNPNAIEAQTYSWRIMSEPEFNPDGTSRLPMGPIAMAVNGVAMYNPYTRTCCDAGTAELDLFDMCTGHPGPGGGYHYHIYPTCVEDIVCNTPSSIIGVAFDGFPIYGPIDENGRQLVKADLDECNGRTDSNGNYKYHIISEFPYIMGCYKGMVIDGSITLDGECTSPVEVCTEFEGNTGGTGGGGGGHPPPPHPPQRVKRSNTRLFTCCTDEQTCSVTRIFVPDKQLDGEGDGSAATQFSVVVLVISLVTATLNALI